MNVERRNNIFINKAAPTNQWVRDVLLLTQIVGAICQSQSRSLLLALITSALQITPPCASFL